MGKKIKNKNRNMYIFIGDKATQSKNQASLRCYLFVLLFSGKRKLHRRAKKFIKEY